MTAFQKSILGIALFALALLAWLGRYSIVVGHRGDFAPPAYVLDRWTGKVSWVIGGTIRETVPPKPDFEDLVPAGK